jgi:hypothetical protein
VAATSKGCVWNQDVPALVAAAGLDIASRQQHLGGTLTTLVAVKPEGSSSDSSSSSSSSAGGGGGGDGEDSSSSSSSADSSGDQGRENSSV